MKKTIAILIAVLLVCAGFGFWFRDHGIAKNGKDIAMIQEINPKKDSVLTVEHTAQDGQYELDESKTEILKNLLLAGKYRTISESVYQILRLQKIALIEGIRYSLCVCLCICLWSLLSF